MSDVFVAEFTDRGCAKSVSEGAKMAHHTGGSSGESDSSYHDAVLITRTPEALDGLEDEDSDGSPQNRSKKRVNKLIDSDSETEGPSSPNSNEDKVKTPVPSDSIRHSQDLANELLDSHNICTSNKGNIKNSVNSSDTSSDESNISNTAPHKSRIKRINSSDTGSDSGNSMSLTKEQCDNSNEKTSKKTKKLNKKLPNSDSSNSDSEIRPSKYEEQKARMKEKRSKLQNKFKSLVTSRGKETSVNGNESKKGSSSGNEQNKSESSNSNDEADSIERIKQKIRDRTVHLKSSIYDPDTSSDEETAALKHVQKKKIPKKSNKPASPKPMRMSAKQAMENMQKIKSESNRMLREKEVSLPYHRPKALSLKDIMSKRRPALTADGKSLPIKMTEEQLKLYAESLEQRQKEVIELCKSDTDEECDENQPATEIETNDNAVNYDGTKNLDKNVDTNYTENKTDPEANIDMSAQHDTLFDILPEETNKSILDDTNVTSDDQNTNYVENKTEKQNDSEISPNIVEEDALNDITGKQNDEECTETQTTLVNNDLIENMDTSVDKPKELDDKPNMLESDILNILEDKPYSIENNKPNFEIIESKQLQNTENSVHLNSNIHIGSEVDSQLIHLHYDDTEPLQEKPESEKKDVRSPKKVSAGSQADIQRPLTDNNAIRELEDKERYKRGELMETDEVNKCEEDGNDYGFSDDDIDMADIDELIENADIISNQTDKQNFDSPTLIKDPKSNNNPKLAGAPGMIIDLDGTDPTHRKLTGVQLLKERFSYFSKLKTAEEMERDREKKLKPGNKHQILKQELEDQIAEQRSLEWTKRLETEKQLHKELELNEEKGSDEEDIDKVEAKLNESEAGGIQGNDEKESSGESEPEENDCDMSDKPVKRNPMLADEAEESDCDEEIDNIDENSDPAEDGNDEDNGEDDSEEESSESEEEEEATSNPKRGRILKAFEDSDEEVDKQEVAKAVIVNEEINGAQSNSDTKESVAIKSTQDDDLQLAQHLKSQSEDLFSSQGSTLGIDKDTARTRTSLYDETNLGTQTFSIGPDAFKIPDKLSICDSQLSQDGNLDAVVGMCSGSFSQAIPVSQLSSQLPESQIIGDDVLALCTGKFYDNQFISQNVEKNDENQQNDEIKSSKDNETIQNSKVDKTQCQEIEEKIQKENEESQQKYNETQDVTIELTDLKDTRPITESMELNNTVINEPISKDDILESILDELNEPEKKPNKYFIGNKAKENELNVANIQYKKKFVIDSDDEGQSKETGQRKKKLKKTKMEKRALQISDDESDQSDEEVEDENASEINEDNEERVVEYDSDENEVEIVKKMQIPKKKHKAPEFFEQEAELTSEDEWIGSGDEDEAGLDRMEREEGDDDKFNERQLQRELGQIHMRDVLDQDKREVRIIQELLFEDGDLGTGSRQRKFRWKNAEGDEETGTVVNALPDTQEEEFESEEQWRKQRHEREMFLREMQKQNDSEDLLDINMTLEQTVVKANVSKSTSLVQNATTEITTVEVEQTTVKEVPSPKKSAFTLFKKNYHSSVLSRGQGALARLAAIATPLAADEDAPKVGSVASGRKRNFVFATLTQEDVPKVTKRKSETNTGTPRLVKKLRTEDKPKLSKSSLLDHMKV